MIKRFEDWIKLKKKLHHVSSSAIPFFKEGEIWWCGMGDNVGSEINGKSQYFSRPVFIFRKFNKECFFGLPLSSKIKIGTWFVQVRFKSNLQTVVLNQGRTLDSRRLQTLMGQLDETNVKKIKVGFRRLYLDIPSNKRGSWEIPKLFLNLIKFLISVKPKCTNK